MTRTQNDTILVLGGTGKTGRRVAERLRADGHAVRIGSRSATPAFDWHDRDTWATALDGVRSAYVAFHPDLAVPGAAETVEAFAQQARAAGVERIVLLSGRSEPAAERAENAVMAAHPDTTVLRCAWFLQNFDESFFVDAVREGVLALPVRADVREPFIDADDIADAAVHALTASTQPLGVQELTGAESLTFDELTSLLGEAAGHPVRFQPIPVEAFAAGLAAAGTPPELTELLVYLMTEVLDGRNAHTTDTVETLLGRPPRSAAEFARRAAATGVWSRAEPVGAPTS